MLFNLYFISYDEMKAKKFNKKNKHEIKIRQNQKTWFTIS